MDNQPICPCRMKKDLEKADDPLAFVNEHFIPSSILENLKDATRIDLECTCCLVCTAFQLISNKPSRFERLMTMIHLRK